MKDCGVCNKPNIILVPVKLYPKKEVRTNEICPSCLMRLVFIGAEEINKEGD